MNIIKNNWLIRKFISYSIITLLVLNLFSGISGGKAAFATEEDGIQLTLDIIPNPNVEGKNKLKITYGVTDWTVAAGATLHWTVKRDGSDVGSYSVELPGTEGAWEKTQEYKEDGSYTIEYHIEKGSYSSPPQSIIKVLDNIDPEVTIGDEAGGTIYDKIITITDSYLGDDCCKLQYKKKSFNGLEVVESTGEYNVTRTEGTGVYTATINIEEIVESLGDGIYSDFVVKATDLGGNTKEVSRLQRYL